MVGYYTISGNAGVACAIIRYMVLIPNMVTHSDSTGTVTADASGNYSFGVPSGWSGTVVPSMAGYIFIPPSYIYTNVVTDLTNQNFNATVTFYIHLPLITR